MNCDVCNAATTEKQSVRVGAKEFRRLLDKGFGIDETNIKMLSDAGVSRDKAIAMLAKQYAMSQSDWLLCTACSARAKAIS